MSYVFHPETPADCPTNDAEPAGIIFRAVPKLPAECCYFEPDALHNPSIDRKRCDSWGCSVWPDTDAVQHGRRNYQSPTRIFFATSSI